MIIIITDNTTRLIHKGLVIHHHDQEIVFVSLSTKNTINIVKKLIDIFIFTIIKCDFLLNIQKDDPNYLYYYDSSIL